jgi:hypothetical protein
MRFIILHVLQLFFPNHGQAGAIQQAVSQNTISGYG